MDVMLYLDKAGHLSQLLNSIRTRLIQVQVHQDIQRLLPRTRWVEDQFHQLHLLVAELEACLVEHLVVGVLVLRPTAMIQPEMGR